MTVKKFILGMALALPLVAAPVASSFAADQEKAPPIPPSAARPQDVPPPEGPRFAIPKFSEEGHKLMIETFSKLNESTKPTVDALMRTQQEVHALLGAESFSKEAYLEKEGQLRNLHAILEESRSQAIAELAAKLSPADRKVLALFPVMHRPAQAGQAGPGAGGFGPRHHHRLGHGERGPGAPKDAPEGKGAPAPHEPPAPRPDAPPAQ